MADSTSQLSGIDAALEKDLLVFYDEFVEFEGYCAFLCDAFACMASAKFELHEATQRGVEAFTSKLKQRVGELKSGLKIIQEKSSIRE